MNELCGWSCACEGLWFCFNISVLEASSGLSKRDLELLNFGKF